ncbi:MAG: flavoprotein, partial [Tumebacillaceae bacterium]
MSGKKEYVVGMTGASGAVYAIRLVQELCRQSHRVHLLLSDSVYQVFQLEMGWDIEHGDRAAIPALFGVEGADLHIHAPRDYGAPVASGSHLTEGMIVIPCSTFGAQSPGRDDHRQPHRERSRPRSADHCRRRF